MMRMMGYLNCLFSCFFDKNLSWFDRNLSLSAVSCSFSLVVVLQLVGCDLIDDEDDRILELYEDGSEDKVEDVRHIQQKRNILQCLIMKIVILIISYKMN